MKKMNIRSYAVLLAALLIMLGTVGLALAYFTDYDEAYGRATLNLNGGTTIDEGSSDAQKDIVIHNDQGETYRIVRVAVFGPDKMQVTVPSGWTKSDDGFYYYNSVLAPGADTGSPIVALIPDLTDKERAELGSTIDITVVHESAVAVYKDDNTVKIPDGWDQSVVIQ